MAGGGLPGGVFGFRPAAAPIDDSMLPPPLGSMLVGNPINMVGGTVVGIGRAPTRTDEVDAAEFTIPGIERQAESG